MNITIIAAMDKNRGIGFRNKIPWHLPNDLKMFKEKTMNHSVVMGVNTFKSLKKPLSNRTNIILSNNDFLVPEGCLLKNSLPGVLKECKKEKETFIIGGASVYEQFLPLSNKLILTFIDATFFVDTYFPDFSTSQWKCTEKKEFTADQTHAYNYSFRTYELKE